MLKDQTKISFGIIFLFTVLAAAAFYDVTFLGKTFKATTANSQALPTGAYDQAGNKPRFIPVNGTDAPVMEEPVYEFIKRNLRKGILPLWNPHQGCGFPLIGMIEAGIFFPLSLIMYTFPEIYSWDILILSRFLLAGLFTFWLMRSLGFSVICAAVAGVAFMLSGPMVLMQYWTVNVDILTPLLLVGTDRLIRDPSRKKISLLGLTVGLTGLAGHPEHVFLVNIYGACFFLYRLFSTQRIPALRNIVLAYLASYLLGLGLCAIVTFPFFRNLLFEFWHGHPEGVGLLVEEQPGRALTLALPFFFQKVPLTYQWEFSGWWGGYIGLLPLGLASLSLFHPSRRGLNYFFAVMAFVIIGKQYGLPIINALGALPIFNLCRYAIHAPHLAAFTVAVLAGFGTEAVLTRKDLCLKGIPFTAGLILIVLFHLNALKSSEILPVSLRAALVGLAALASFQAVLLIKDKGWLKNSFVGMLVVSMVYIELFSYIHRERPYRFASFGKVPYLEFLKSSPQRCRSYGIFWAFYPNTATGFGVDDLGYFFSVVPKRFVEFVNTLLVKDHFRNNLRPPALRAIPIQNRDSLLDLLNVQYLVTPATDDFSSRFPHFEKISDRFPLVYDREVKIYQRPGAFPRVFVVHRALFQTDKTETLRTMALAEGRLRDAVIINSPPLAKIAGYLSSIPPHDRSRADIISYSPNEVIVDAQMESGGFLVFSDAFHPDWRAFVDGKPWKIYQANFLMRAVFLPPGRHTVTFLFRPPSFYVGAVVSGLSLALFLVLLIRTPSRERDDPA